MHCPSGLAKKQTSGPHLTPTHLYEQGKEDAPVLSQQVGAQLRGVMLHIRQQDVCGRGGGGRWD